MIYTVLEDEVLLLTYVHGGQCTTNEDKPGRVKLTKFDRYKNDLIIALVAYRGVNIFLYING